MAENVNVSAGEAVATTAGSAGLQTQAVVSHPETSLRQTSTSSYSVSKVRTPP